MAPRLDALQAGEPPDALFPVFKRDEVALAMNGREFLGVITRST